ncbi:MAG TPA: hypothetical protein ENK63_02905 [Rhodobacterales bacterium]|nr:hypothetical protein [Rhodobacterales bacterium]
MAETAAQRLGIALGLSHGQRVAWVGLPAALGILTIARRFARSELAIRGRDLSPGPFDVIHIFSMSQGVLEAELPEARKRLAPAGVIWVSWPAPKSAMPTDLDGDGVIRLAGETVLHPGQPAPLDARWSMLPLTIGAAS